MVQLEAVGLATLCSGSMRIDDGNITETWKGPVQTELGQRVAYVKILPENQLISETVCAILARALNLDVPRPYLVLVKKGQLKDSNTWRKGQSEKICFGSEDVDHPSLKRIINPRRKKKIVSMHPALEKKIMDAVIACDGFQETAIFDEWVANMDRNTGNLLWDGNKFYPIDHSHALTGGKWKPANLIPSVMVANILLDYVQPALSWVERGEWRAKAELQRFRYQDLAISTLQDRARMDLYDRSGLRDEAINFIQKRVDSVLQLICTRLRIGILPI